MQRICARHAGGNGTIAAVLEAAAIALDLDLGAIEHSDDHFMHAAFARDRLRLRPPPLPPLGAGGPPRVPAPLAPVAEVLGLIENPLRRAGTDPVGRNSGELFHLVRRGFERALLQVRITGMGEALPLTFGPLLVNRDEGHGIGFAGVVPPGFTSGVRRNRAGDPRWRRRDLIRLRLPGRDLRRRGFAGP